MRWFWRRIAVLCLGLLLLIGSVIFVNRAAAAPNPLRGFGLDSCGDRACFKGIIPAVTTWDRAQHIIGIAGTTPLPMARVHVILDNVDFVAGTDDGKQVADIFIGNSTDKAIPDLGNFLLQYGKPCAVTAYNGLDLLELRYPSFVLDLDMSEANAITAETPVFSVYLFAGGMCSAQGLAVTPWLGFASFDHYHQHGLPLP